MGLIIQTLESCQNKDKEKDYINKLKPNKEKIRTELDILDESFYKNIYNDLLLYNANIEGNQILKNIFKKYFRIIKYNI